MEYTTIYKVYGCDTGREPILYAEFLDLKSACKYAVAQYGKIHYNLPEVEKHTYFYNPEIHDVVHTMETIKPEQIHYMNKI